MSPWDGKPESAFAESPNLAELNGALGPGGPGGHPSEHVRSVWELWSHSVARFGWLPCLGARAKLLRPFRTDIATSASSEYPVWYTYGDVDTLVANLAAGLASELGLRAGDKVALLSEPNLIAFVAFLALVRIGVVVVLVKGDGATLRKSLDRTGCVNVISSKQMTQVILSCRSRVLQHLILLSGVDSDISESADSAGLRLSSVTQYLKSGAALPMESAHVSYPDDVAVLIPTITEDPPIKNTAEVADARVGAEVDHLSIHPVMHGELLDWVATVMDTNLLTMNERNRRRQMRQLKKEHWSAASFPVSGTYLSHQPLANIFEFVLLLSCIDVGYSIAFTAEQQTSFFVDCRTFQPTVLTASQQTFATLKVQLNNTQRSWTRLSRFMFQRLFGFRASLLRIGRDSRTLRRWVFRSFERQLGEKVQKIIIPSTERVPYGLRQFIQVCYTPMVREVAFNFPVGFLCVDGLLPPRVLVRIREHHPNHRFSFQSPCGELQFRKCSEYGPASSPMTPRNGSPISDGEDTPRGQSPKTPWIPSGVIASWRGDGGLSVMCTTGALLWPLDDFYVISTDLEREFRRFSPFIVNVFVTCRAGKPLVAIVVPHRDAVEDWIRKQGLGHSADPSDESGGMESSGGEGAPSRSWTEMVRVATPLILEDFRRIAVRRGWHSFQHVKAVHLHAHPFAAHSDFFDMDNALRRERLNKYFEHHIRRLYDSLSLRDEYDDGDESWSTKGRALRSSIHPPPGEPGGMIQSPIISMSQKGSWSPLMTPSTMSPLGSFPAVEAPKASNVAPLAVDIGGTCGKIVYFMPPDGPTLPPFVTKEHGSLGVAFPRNVDCFVEGKRFADGEDQPAMPTNRRCGTLQFLKMATHQVPRYVEFIERNNIASQFLPDTIRTIPATGGGAYKFSGLVEERLNVKFIQHKEMDCIMRGLNYLLSFAPDTVFTYDTATQAPKPAQLPSDVSAVYPFLLVNMGSGVSVIKCLNAEGDHVRVGGSAIGGGTFWGLVKALTNITSWEEIHELTREDGPGDNTNIDLLVGDIYGFSATNLPLKLTVDTVASTFGKIASGRGHTGDSSPPPQSPSSRHPDPEFGDDANFGEDEEQRSSTPSIAGSWGAGLRPVDVVRSLLIMIANNVTQLAYLLAKVENAPNIFFTGGFIRENPVVWRQITRSLQYWSGGAMQAHFFQHDGYLGALGALFSPQNPGGTVPPVARGE